MAHNLNLLFHKVTHLACILKRRTKKRMLLPKADDSYTNVEQEIAYKLENKIEDLELVDLLNIYSEKLRLYNQNFLRSLEYCKIAREISKKLNYEIGYAWASLNLGSCLIYMDFSLEPCKIIEESLEIFRRLQIVNGEAHALMILGAAKLAIEDYVSAYNNLEKGLNLSILINDKKGEVLAYYLLADFSKKLEDHDSIINYCKLALSVADDFDMKGRIYAQLGANLLKKGEIDEAKKYLRLALEKSETFQDKFTMSKVFIHLGKISLKNGELDKAKEKFNKGLDLTRKIGLLDYSTFSLDEISTSLIELKDYESALEILRRFQEIVDINKSPHRLAIILMKIALVKIKLKELDIALDLVEQVWVVANHSKNNKLQYECQKAFADIFEMNGDYKMAYLHHVLFHQFKEEFDKRGMNDKIKILANRIEVEKEREIKEFTKQKNVEVAQMIYEFYEKVDDLTIANQRIVDLEIENNRLQASKFS